MFELSKMELIGAYLCELNSNMDAPLISNYDVEQDMPVFYVGNMYSNTLTNSTNQQDKLRWETVALKYLEGSEEMFTNRRDIYGI